jgi:hypothetical protein
MRRQQAMFALSDQISSNAFYVAADVWTYYNKSWKLGKIFGAFSDALSFVLSDSPQLQYTTLGGAKKRFIDSSVYSRNGATGNFAWDYVTNCLMLRKHHCAYQVAQASPHSFSLASPGSKKARG